MKQVNLFGTEFLEEKKENKYTSKIKTPVYEPKNKCPNILELLDTSKTDRLILEIQNSNISNTEKEFLIQAAKRHNIFNYSKIADYYAFATPEMQNLMERSALVIIDFEKAIYNGYIKLSEEIRIQHLEEYGN